MALIKLRRDTAANWTTANPVLAAGEPAYETDTGRSKLGDGTTAWTALSYFGEIAKVVDNLNSSSNISFWVGTQAEYDALGAWGGNTLYFIT